MTINRKYIAIMSAFLLWTISLLVVIYFHRLESVQFENYLSFKLIYDICEKYQLRQILSSIILTGIGYIYICCIDLEMSQILRFLLAAPCGVAIWASISLMMILLRVPLSKYSLLLAIFGIMAVILFVRKPDVKYLIGNFTFISVFVLIVISLCNIFSTGVVRFYADGDYFQYVMQYGEIIAKTGGVYAETAGSVMAQTGIMMPLLSAGAAIFGFETFIIVHFLLIVSLFLTLLYLVIHQFGIKKENIVILLSIFLCGIFPFVVISGWIVSNAWFMVYVFLLMSLIENAIREHTDNTGFYCLMSLFAIFLSLCRIEGSVSVCFLLICLSVLDIKKKNYLILIIPMMILSLVFQCELQLLLANSTIEISSIDIFVTPKVVAVIFLSLLLTLAWGFLYDRTIFQFLRKRLHILSLCGLGGITIFLMLMNFEKFINNVTATFENFVYEYCWGYFPLIISIFIVINITLNRSLGYWEMLIIGYIVFHFDICMGREAPLRYGLGDSYNRILLSIVPICLYYMIYEILIKREHLMKNIRRGI